MPMKKILWWLIAGTKGGINRARILSLLNERPYNAHQLAEKLDLDYKTVRHHIKVLEDNNIWRKIWNHVLPFIINGRKL